MYMGPITHRYAEVFWTELPETPVPPEIVERFKGKGMVRWPGSYFAAAPPRKPPCRPATRPQLPRGARADAPEQLGAPRTAREGERPEQREHIKPVAAAPLP